MTEPARPQEGAGREGGPIRPIDQGTLRHARYDIDLCEIEEWVEDGLHVVSGKDFDLVAVGETEQEALQKFAVEVKSLVDALEGPIERGEATREEETLYLRLVKPLVAVLEREAEDMRAEQRRLEVRLIDFPRLRRKRSAHSDEWRTASSHGTLKQPSLV